MILWEGRKRKRMQSGKESAEWHSRNRIVLHVGNALWIDLPKIFRIPFMYCNLICSGVMGDAKGSIPIPRGVWNFQVLQIKSQITNSRDHRPFLMSRISLITTYKTLMLQVISPRRIYFKIPSLVEFVDVNFSRVSPFPVFLGSPCLEEKWLII